MSTNNTLWRRFSASNPLISAVMLFVMLDYAHFTLGGVFIVRIGNRVKLDNALRGKYFHSRWFLVLWSPQTKSEIQIGNYFSITMRSHSTHLLNKRRIVNIWCDKSFTLWIFGYVLSESLENFSMCANGRLSLMFSSQTLWIRRRLHIEAIGK